MSHWNPASGGWERSPMDTGEDETQPIPGIGGQPGWGGGQPGRGGGQAGPGSGQPGWGGGQPPLYSAPPADPYQQQPQPGSSDEEPPIWAGRHPPGSAGAPVWENQQPPSAYLRQQPEPPGHGRRGKAVLAAAAVILVLVAGGTALAVEMRSHGGGHAAQARRTTRAQAPASSQPAPAAGRGTPAPPSASPAAPGHPHIAVAPAASRNPAAPRVVNFLSSYFAAINSHDYQAFRRLLDAQVQQIETAQRFSTGFRSTRDSGVTLAGLSAAPDGRLAAAVTFTSHQSPADSPDQSSCTHWTITLYLEPAGASYVIGPPAAGYQALDEAC